MTELSDAEVFGETKPKELSDAEVFSAPPPDWRDTEAQANLAAMGGEQPKEGGLLQTIPQGIEFAGSEQGRAKLWEGIKKFPGDFAQGMLDFVKTPGKGYSEGLTPEEEVAFGLNAALGTIGTGTKFPRMVAEAIVPHVQEFHNGVMQPAAQQLAHDAIASPPAMLNEIKARSGQPENIPTGITAYHGSPHSFEVFSSEHIGAGEGAQAYGHGLYFAESKSVGEYYKNDSKMISFAKGKDWTGTEEEAFGWLSENNYDQKAASDAVAKRISQARMYGDSADSTASLHEVKDLIDSGWRAPQGTLYQVLIKADRENFLDLDKPIAQQSATVRSALEALGVSGEETAEKAYRRLGVKVGPKEMNDTVGREKAASAALADAGIPGIKYLDQGSRGKSGTQNFVVFNEGDVQITHKNGEPVPTPMLDNIIEAKRSGIVGPDIPPPPGESPAVAAQRAIPAASQPGDKITMTPAGEPIDAWQERFNRYVDKTETPDDFKTLVKDMAAQNNNFPEARAGDVAPDMVAKVAEAAGLDPSAISGGKLRTSFRTDEEIRTVTTLLKKLGDDVQSAAELVRTNDSPESLAAFQAAIIKRDYALEATLSHTVALRAEWGRSGNALQEILRAQKGEDPLTKLLQDKGRSVDDLRDIARGLNGLDREQAAKVLTGMRGQAPHWFYWLWTQGLISGPFTHAKYVLANATYATMERGVVTPLASIIGAAKKIAGAADTDRVFFGETAAAYYGTIAAVPDAIMATYQTIKSGMRVPLETEKQLHALAIAAGEKPSTVLSRVMEPNLQPPRPIPGIWGRILGSPGDVASSIHVAFKVLGERANLEMAAYNKAAAEGLSPTGSQFWERRAYHALNPTEKALKDSVYQAYKDTFMQELGEHGKKFQELTKKIPGLKWVFPFTHIPINLMKATYEYTPFAVLDKEMRANIKGENGGRAQDLAIARMTVGSSVMAYFAHKYMQGEVTSNYPTDQNERKDWALQHKPANSIQIGDRWVSFERFGPAGDLAQLGAAIASVGHRFALDKNAPDKGFDEAFSHAVWATVNAAANTIGNEVGFQSLRNFMDAIQDEKKGGSFASYQATSMLPFSSLLSQTASFMDPHTRVAKSMVNGLLNRLPVLRETLAPKRDPLYGEPVENPGHHGILRSEPINTDPVKLELERVNLHPSAPRDVIGGVKLTPEQYDRYQATAGPLVQRALESLVNHPGWQSIPAPARADTLRATISAMRQQAATAMQIAEPKLVQQGLQQRLDYISGKTNTPRPKRPPELPAQP